MPRDDDDDDTLDTGKPTPKGQPQPEPQAKPSRFHSRYLKDAERLLTPEEIEECSSNAELRDLIEHAEKRVAAEEERSRSRQSRRQEPAQQVVSPPPPPPEPQKYKFKKNLDHVDADLREALQDLADDLVKATKKGDKDRIDDVLEKIEALEAENKALRAKNHPGVRKANKILDSYQMFGTQEDREDPNSREAKLAKMVEDHIFGTMQEEGSFTGKPEKDIPAAMAVLFPGVKPGGKEAPPASRNGHEENGKPAKSRVDTWADSGDVPPTQRNGADRTGKPGGTRAAVQKVKEKRRELGLTGGDDDADDDLDDDI